MRRHTFAVVVGLSGLLGGFWVTACSVDTNGAAPSPARRRSSMEPVVADGTSDQSVPADVVEPEEATTDASARHPDAGGGDGAAEAAAAPCSAANCGRACCGDKCVDRTCQGCASGSLFCPYSTTIPNSNGECVASCFSCQALGADGGVACFSCASGATQGTCAASLDQCASDTAAGACACAPDAGACPGATQVCVESDGGGTCLSCGMLGTQGLTCSSGSTCAQGSAACQ